MKKNEATKGLAQLITTATWNSDQKYTLIKVIKGLLRGDLMKTVVADYKRSKDMDYYMGVFYRGIQEIDKALSIDENSLSYLVQLKNSMFPSKNNYKDVLTDSILQENFRLLQQEKLLSYLDTFGEYFRGEMVAIHKIPHSDIIIFELKQKPFSNEKQYHWDEPDEKKFYSNKNLRYVWRTFEECLINASFPQHYAAVIALLKAEKEE